MLINRLLRDIVKKPSTDLYDRLIHEGRGYTYSDRVNDLAGGESVYVFVDNPSDSGFEYDFALIPRSTGLTDIDISYGANSGDVGIEGSVENVKSGSDNTFSGTVEDSLSTDTGTLPSHGTMLVEDFVPGTGRGTNVSAEVIADLTGTIDEGDDKLFELRNESGGSVDRIGLGIVIFERDGTY